MSLPSKEDLFGLQGLREEFAALRRELSDEHKQTLQINILNEELRTRWQQLLQWDDTVDKWMASYAIGLVIGVSWVLSTERISELHQFFSQRNNDNSYFILSLAFVNAVYLLFITFKGYQIHQLRIYLFTNICGPLNEIAGVRANQWEKWHRTGRTVKPEWRRKVYYPIMTIAPFGVSVLILCMYLNYVGFHLQLRDPHNLTFYFVALLHIPAIVLAASTANVNSIWTKAIEATDEKVSNSKTSASPDFAKPIEVAGCAEVLQPKGDFPSHQLSADATTFEIRPERTDINAVTISIVGFSLLAGSLLLVLKDKIRSKP